MTGSKLSPIRIFITQADRAKLSYLAGDALETPNKIGAMLLTDAIRQSFLERQEHLDAAADDLSSDSGKEEGLPP